MQFGKMSQLFLIPSILAFTLGGCGKSGGSSSSLKSSGDIAKNPFQDYCSSLNNAAANATPDTFGRVSGCWYMSDAPASEKKAGVQEVMLIDFSKNSWQTCIYGAPISNQDHYYSLEYLPSSAASISSFNPQSKFVIKNDNTFQFSPKNGTGNFTFTRDDGTAASAAQVHCTQLTTTPAAAPSSAKSMLFLSRDNL